MDVVDAFETFIGFHAANQIAHLTLEDYNLDDDSIDSDLRHMHEQRDELLSDDGIAEVQIEMCRAFLTFLKAVPEDMREWDENDD